MILVKLALIGLVTVLLSSVQAQTVNYSYDDAGRLTRVDYGASSFHLLRRAADKQG